MAVVLPRRRPCARTVRLIRQQLITRTLVGAVSFAPPPEDPTP